jgi:eukaryotic-like serine/threonine-protein kinase
MAPTHPSHGELIKFASGGLAQNARAQLYKHLETCVPCRKVVESVREPSAPKATPIELGLPNTSGEFKTRQVTDMLIGATLGEYRVVERLGQGGMGVLYRGVQPIIGKQVAIKVVLSEIAGDPTVAQRMIDEARAVNAAKHKNIVDIFAFGQLPDGRPYMVMELLHGQSLGEMLSTDKRLPAEQAMVVLDQCFAGLEAAHKVGVIHRDLKPENIYVDQRTPAWKVTLLDFGLATRQGKSADAKLTQPGTVVGTPGFMAPEQVRGAGELSPQTDVYAMGVVAWTMLVGKEPFEGGSIVEVMHRQLSKQAPPIRELVPEVPERLEQLVLKMMAKEPDQRPTDKQVRAEIASIQGRPAPGPAAIASSGAAANPRSRLLLALATGVVALGLAGAAVWGLSRDEARPTDRPIEVAQPAPAPTPAPGVDAGEADVAQAPDPVAPPVKKPRRARSDTSRTWRCEELASVTPIYESVTSPALVFELSFSSGTPVLISESKGKAGAKKFRALHKQIKRCKGSELVVEAKITRRHPLWITKPLKKGLQGTVFEPGTLAEGEDISVAADD